MRISDWSSDVCSSDLGPLGDGDEAFVVEGPFSLAWHNALGRQVMSLYNARSEERRVGKSVSVRVDLGGRRILKKKKKTTCRETNNNNSTHVNPEYSNTLRLQTLQR